MRLKYLKIAGFKSFVDPVTIPFPGDLVAVVGPNGCGKSNIIDAFTWGLGESSAKHLRGESMTDVIFNGSSHRKPLGQASVEMVFDNSLGRLAGQFASYAEISVKRLLTRDGESKYFLNGTRCRRRDITDMFLGTGVGARGYAIIGQGTISRLIEAKPEELRVFLEEAADVSKYKERRKETLQRMEQTRDNLTRVADIREELGKQLQRLERQAKAAERYSILKEEERICRAEIQAIKWQDFKQQQKAKQQTIQELALSYEQQQSLLTAAYAKRTAANERANEAADMAQKIQNQLYQYGTEIARVEEIIQQQERERKRLEHERQQMQEDWQLAQEQLKDDQEALEQSRYLALNAAEKAKESALLCQEKEQQREEALNRQQEIEARWQDSTNAVNNSKRELQVTQLNLQHAKDQQQAILLRLEKLQQERQAISIAALEQKCQELQHQQEGLQEAQRLDQRHLEEAQEKGNQLRQQLETAEQQLNQSQDEYHRLHAEYAALAAEHKVALQSLDKEAALISDWQEKPRLIDLLQVEPKWQLVCERILDDNLQAYVLDNFDEAIAKWAICQGSGAKVVTLKAYHSSAAAHPCLADKIKGAIPASLHALQWIYTAETWEEGLSWLDELPEFASVVTPEGLWFGKGWARFVSSERANEPGILARQEEMTVLSKSLESAQNQLEAGRTRRSDLQAELQESQRFVDLFQLNLRASSDALSVNLSNTSACEQELLYAKKQAENFSLECEALQIEIEALKEKEFLTNTRLGDLEVQLQEEVQQLDRYVLEKNQCREILAHFFTELEALRNSKHQLEMEANREQSKIQQLGDRMMREQERLVILQDRLESAAQQSLQAQEPNAALKQQLTELLTQHTETETQLSQSREEAAQWKLELEQIDKQAMAVDGQLKQVQELMAQTRMQEQELAVRASAVEESLSELGLEAQSLLDKIPEGTSQAMREDTLLSISQKIRNLGAINLAAIEEFATERERKQYLDEQYEDLNQALDTLSTAIEKMDQETRFRLEDTFNQVNASFKTLFPRLFGGGSAQLQLTCDNLLEAGIVVMAQPPGKRNSTIHLLSGGEKALTAVALVFAIFQLNPSPFCMLDEVDAPLDDVNVGRFCELVKEMSQVVQFLFITHNKVAMEMADHLIGVTMREPGVSRLVAVDVKQALTME